MKPPGISGIFFKFRKLERLAKHNTDDRSLSNFAVFKMRMERNRFVGQFYNPSIFDEFINMRLDKYFEGGR